jgi:1-acyl-sn-glycerol-3-phosphate acyltransferase
MLPPTPIRRLLLVPLVVLIAGALAALTPPVAMLSAAYSLIRRRGRAGGERHSRLLRVIFLGLAWSAAETAALIVFLSLWIASGFGGRLDTEPYQARHYAVMCRFLDAIFRAARRACGLRVTVTGPQHTSASPAGDRPLIVLSRHAGPGDSLLLIHHLVSTCERRPRVVMKATLQLDPSVDILANRLPNAFLRKQPNASRHAARQRTEQIRRLAAGLSGRDALVIFPEGGNWTPFRWRRAIDHLSRSGRPDLAERAAAMPNVLPPRASGALTAIAACPAADVIFVAHTGLDRLVSVRDVWRGLLGDMEVRARWWRVPAANVPRSASHDTQVTWLYDWWQRVDAWITEENAAPRDTTGGGASPDSASPDSASPDSASPDSASPDSASPDSASPAVGAGSIVVQGADATEG